MDWLLARQDSIEATLAARHLNPAANPAAAEQQAVQELGLSCAAVTPS